MSSLQAHDAESAARNSFVKAAERVLETMFFDSLCGAPEEQDPPAGLRLARVAFRGRRMGWLEVSLNAEATKSLTGNFLGLDLDPTPEEASSTLAELSNMFCGAFLSLHDPHGAFEIGSPRVSTIDAGECVPVSGRLSRWQVLPISAGGLYWRLFWDEVC